MPVTPEVPATMSLTLATPAGGGWAAAVGGVVTAGTAAGFLFERPNTSGGAVFFVRRGFGCETVSVTGGGGIAGFTSGFTAGFLGAAGGVMGAAVGVGIPWNLMVRMFAVCGGG